MMRRLPARVAVTVCAAALAGNAHRTVADVRATLVEVHVLEEVPLPGGGSGSFRLGGLSDLCRGAAPDSLWTLTDRGPNGLTDGKRREQSRRTLASPGFAPLLVEVALGGNDGRFWMAEEYGPSLVEVSPTGRILGRYVPRGHAIPGAPAEVHDVLPAAYAGRRDNRGFECLACSPDESRLFCLLQSPVGDGADAAAAAGNVRMLVFDAAAGGRARLPPRPE